MNSTTMDYKYIQQLLERYWEGETSIEEEQILRSFFSQKEVPADLKRYQPLFAFAAKQQEKEVLGKDFDERILAIIDQEEEELTATTQVVKARKYPFAQRLMPIFKAAAVVAVFLTVGNAVQVSFKQDTNMAHDPYHYQQQSDASAMALTDTTLVDSIQKADMEAANTLIK